MASTFILKRKNYTLLKDGSGKSILDFKTEFNKLGGQEKLGKSFKEWYRGSSPTTVEVGGSAVSQGASGSAIGNANAEIAKQQAERAAQRTANKVNASGVAAAAKKARTQGYNTGYNKAANTIGVGQGMKNTWGRMGTMKKAGVVAGVAAGGYLLGKGLGLWGNNKEK